MVTTAPTRPSLVSPPEERKSGTDCVWSPGLTSAALGRSASESPWSSCVQR